jgi:hypothetical protein
MEPPPDDKFRFSIDYLLNENDKKYNVENLFKIEEWTKFLIDNYCIIPDNIDFEKEIYISNMSYTDKQKEYNTSSILNIFCHLKFKKLYSNFWVNAINSLDYPNKFEKVCKSCIRQFKMIVSSFLINHSKSNNIPLNLEFLSTLFIHLDSETLFQNIRIFIIKAKDFINLSKTENGQDEETIYNLVKCAITCYVFQSIINETIPDINIYPSPEVIFFIAGCYSIVDGLVDNNTDTTKIEDEDNNSKGKPKTELEIILKYIGKKMNELQNLIFTPNLNKKTLTKALLDFSKNLKLINSNCDNTNTNTNNITLSNPSLIKQINYILDNIIDFFLDITLKSETGDNYFKLSLETLQKYINIIQYNFKLEIHCHTFQKNWDYCSKYQNSFGLTICKGISMGYLSCLQEDIHQFDKIWKLSHKWRPDYDKEVGGFDVIPNIGIFQLFSLLIQILDDLGDFKDDKNSGIITSVVFPVFSNYVVNPNLKLDDINETVFKKYINSSYVVLFTFFYHITKINNKRKSRIQNYLRMIMTVFHQFYYYSITKNEDLIDVSILEKMNINKYYLLENKTIMKLRTMKNNNKNKLRHLLSGN